MATSVTTPDSGPALPDAVSRSTRLYLRPLGLIAGAPAERLLAAGHAVPLADGRFAFGGALMSGPEFEEGNRALFTGRA